MGRIPAGLRLPLVPLSGPNEPVVLAAMKEAGLI
jgi:hypothetical protein